MRGGFCLLTNIDLFSLKKSNAMSVFTFGIIFRLIDLDIWALFCLINVLTYEGDQSYY
jgi:hypothetical protein